MLYDLIGTLMFVGGSTWLIAAAVLYSRPHGRGRGSG